MTDLPRPRRKPYLWPALILLVGVLLALQTVRMRIAEKAVRDGDGATAFAARPQNGWAAALHADALLAAGKLGEARAASLTALNATPYAALSARTLAKTLEKSNSPASAEPVWQVASALGWRDQPTQLWAMLRALSNGQADVFAMRADALLRASRDKRPMTSLIRQAMVAPDVRAPFIARLAARPPWRAEFFNAAEPLRGRELEGTAVALLALRGTHAEPSRQELAAAISGLIAERRYEDAIKLDRAFIARRHDRNSYIDDGGFDLPSTDYKNGVTPFDWTIVGSTVVLDRSGGQRSLAVTTDGARGKPGLVRYVALPPGNYVFRYRTQGAELSPQHIGFALSCAGSDAVLGQSSPSPLTGPGWQTRVFRFAVSGSCGLIKIAMTPAFSDPSVDALIDEVAIGKV